MARTTLTVSQIVRAGLADPAATTGTVDGHRYLNDDHVFLEFNNANVASRVVTFQTPGTVGGYAVADATVTVPGSAARFKVGPFQEIYFSRASGDADAGYVYIDYPAGNETDLTVRAFSV